MAVAFRSAANAHNFYASATLTITKPAGTVNGDLMIAVIGGTPSTLAGWTSIGSAASGVASLGTVHAFFRLASGEGASYAWTLSTSSVDVWGVIASYSGCSATTPVDTVNTTTAAHSGTAFTTAGVTTATGQTLVGWASEYTFLASTSASTTWTVSGATSRSTSSDVEGGSPNNEESSYVICDKTPAAGSNAQTLTASQASAGGVSGIILLNPAGTSASAVAASATAAANGITAVKVPGAAAGSASATASALGPSVAIGVPAGKAAATAAGGGVVLGRLGFPAFATAAGHNAVVQIGWLAHPGAASVTVGAIKPFYVGIGIFPGNGSVSATAFNPIVILPTDATPARTYVVPVDSRVFTADPGDIRVISVPPDA